MNLDTTGYQESQRMMQQSAKIVADILQALLEYLQKEAEYAPYKAMAEWIEGKGQVCVYNIAGDCKGELIHMLDKEKIPYIPYLNTDRIIIKYPDIDFVKDLNERILMQRGDYYQVVDGKKLEDATHDIEKITDKRLFTLEGLTKYEFETMKNKCNGMKPGIMIGVTERDDGLYDLIVPADKVFMDASKASSICRAYMQMTLSLYGPNNDIKMRQIDADEQIDRDVYNLKGKEGVHYIVGVDDPTKYIEITQTGFRYYEVKDDENGEKLVNLAFQCDVDDANYDMEIQRFMDKIYNRAIVSNMEALNEHLSTKDRTIDTDRPLKNKRQYQNSLATKKIGECIDSIIKTRIPNDLSPVEKFEYYQQEAANILQKCITGQDLEGYPEDKINEIKDAFKSNEINPKVYAPVIKHLKDYSADMHIAKDVIDQHKEYKKPESQSR